MTVIQLIPSLSEVMETKPVQDIPKPKDDTQAPIESKVPERRYPACERRKQTWFSDFITESNVAYCLLTEDGEPSTFQEAMSSPNATLWMTAMQEEMEAIQKNRTRELVPLPDGRKSIGNKWVYKVKRNADDKIERYRARRVVKGYAQKEGMLGFTGRTEYPLWVITLTITMVHDVYRSKKVAMLYTRS
ncbi:hypothetical protein OROMI_003142 [Orobanche minor]